MAVIKTIDLVGVSTDSWRDAAAQALAEAAKTLRGIEGMDILGSRGRRQDQGVPNARPHQVPDRALARQSARAGDDPGRDAVGG